MTTPAFDPRYPPEALIDGSRNARLLVLGKHHGTAAEATFGSVSEQAATYAACPTLVLRGPENQNAHGIVVGFDDEASNAALAFAFEEAELRSKPLTVIHVWTVLMAAEPAEALAHVQARREQSLLLDHAIGTWHRKYPRVDVRRQLIDGEAKVVLIEESKSASLLVVGRRGRGGLRQHLIGSTSRVATHRAQCPVAVVHAD